MVLSAKKHHPHRDTTKRATIDCGKKCAFMEFTSTVRGIWTVLRFAAQKIHGITGYINADFSNILIILDYFVIYFRVLPFFQTKLSQAI